MKYAKSKKPFFLWTTILSFYCMSVNAQRVQLTTSLGVSAYKGELNDKPFGQVSPDFSLGATYEVFQKFRARLNLSVLGVRGDDKYQSKILLRERNLSFRSTVWEASFLAEYDLVNEADYFLVPYVFAGPGIYHFDPTTIDRNGKKVYLHDVGTEGQYLTGAYSYLNRKRYNLTQFNLQFGGGLRFIINDNISIAGEMSVRILQTDQLDDVSANRYVDPAVFIAQGQYEAAILSYRGDELPGGKPFSDVKYYPRGSSKYNDMYYSFQIRANFRLNFLHWGKPMGYYGTENYKSLDQQRNPKYVL